MHKHFCWFGRGTHIRGTQHDNKLQHGHTQQDINGTVITCVHTCPLWDSHVFTLFVCGMQRIHKHKKVGFTLTESLPYTLTSSLPKTQRVTTLQKVFFLLHSGLSQKMFCPAPSTVHLTPCVVCHVSCAAHRVSYAACHVPYAVRRVPCVRRCVCRVCRVLYAACHVPSPPPSPRTGGGGGMTGGQGFRAHPPTHRQSFA